MCGRAIITSVVFCDSKIPAAHDVTCRGDEPAAHDVKGEDGGGDGETN